MVSSVSFCGLVATLFLGLNGAVVHGVRKESDMTEQLNRIFYYYYLDYLFTHSPTEEHLGCSQVLAIMQKVAINIYMQVFVWT